ncbi:hypothetical protein HY990_02550 [Candidatus Micrarchaeota archaeon]|nr:hypothetical protein [Candidatus Micrarchaeota archaeon]
MLLREKTRPVKELIGGIRKRREEQERKIELSARMLIGKARLAIKQNERQEMEKIERSIRKFLDHPNSQILRLRSMTSELDSPSVYETLETELAKLTTNKAACQTT